MSQAQNRLKYALRLAAMGFFIFPLRPYSKKPWPDEPWLQTMSVDPDVIRAWFIDRPDMNYAVCPGPHGVVLDLDTKKDDGITAFGVVQTQAEMDEWVDDSFSVKTPTGGRHIYLRVEQPVGNAHSFPAGIDIRGAHGYVVGPGCYTAEDPDHNTVEGEYEALNNNAVLEAPGWVLNRLSNERERTDNASEALFELDTPIAIDRAREFLRRRLVAIEGSGGDAHTYATCTLVKDFGVSEEKCLELMMEPDGWNERCEPPWSGNELASKVRNAYQYGKNPPGAKGGGLDSFDEVEEGSGPLADVEDRFKRLRDLTFFGDQIANRGKTREEIIPEWLPAAGLVMVNAPRGTGKSIFMVDMACRLACDMDWHGHTTDKGWVVIYLCGEDDTGVESMIKAWRMENRRDLPEDRFIFLDGIVDLMSMEDTKFWTEYLHSILKGRRAIVFVDTWQRAASRGSQNDDRDMQHAAHHIEVMAESFRGPAVTASHPPKGKGNENTVLGSSVIENVTTAIIQGEIASHGRKFTVTRMKGPGTGNFVYFNLKKVGFGDIDKFGKEKTGAVFTKVGGTGETTSEFVVNQDRRARVEYAVAIATLLDEAEADLSYQASRDKHFGVIDTANRIKNAATSDVTMRLREIDENISDPALIRKRLEKLFGDNQLPEEVEAGVHLIMRKPKTGTKLRFVTVRATDEEPPV